MKGYFLLFFTLFSFAEIIQAQIDSTLKVTSSGNESIRAESLIHLSKGFIDSYQWDSAHLYAKEALEVIEKQHFNHLKFDIYTQLYHIFLYESSFIEADSLVDIALLYAETSTQKATAYILKANCQHRMGRYKEMPKYLDLSRFHIGNDTLSKNMIRYHYSIANYYITRSDFFSALESAMEAKEKAEGLFPKLFFNIDRILNIIYAALNDYEGMIENSSRLIERFDSLGQHTNKLFSLYALGEGYNKLGKYELTKSTCQRIFKLKKEYGISNAFGYAYYLLGSIAIAESKLDSAIHFFQLGIDISMRQNEDKELSDCYEGMCKVYSLKEEKEKVKYYAELYRTTTDFTNPQVNSLLASIYSEEGQYKKAYQLLDINNAHWLKQDTSNTKRQIVYTLMTENFRKKQEKIELEQKLQQEKLLVEQQNNRLLVFGIMGSLSLLFLTFYFIYRLRLKQQLIKEQKNEIEAQSWRLEQLNKLKDKTFGILAHDLRDPIGGLKNLLGLTKNAELSKNEFDKMIDHLHQNTSAVYDTLNNTLVWSKLQIQGGDFLPQKLNIVKEVERVKEFLKELIKQKSLHFEENIDSHTNIIMNENHLNIVLRNLINNAIKFTPTQGSILVSSEQDKDQITIKVKDTGIGIDATKKGDIFEMGSPDWGTEGEKGIGLGLNLCKEIVEQYNGKIYYTSNLGKGSEFCFSIPHANEL